eukprot:5274235-Amphidinium_carterae.1
MACPVGLHAPPVSKNFCKSASDQKRASLGSSPLKSGNLRWIRLMLRGSSASTLIQFFLLSSVLFKVEMLQA